MTPRVACPECHQTQTRKDGRTPRGSQRFECSNPDCSRKVFLAPKDRFRPRFPEDPTRAKYMRAYRAKHRQIKVYFQSTRQEWETPETVFQQLDAEFHFTIDVCASPENAKCPRYWTDLDDGIVQDWRGEVCWMNPPYGRHIIDLWILKAWESARQGATVVALIPARTDTIWWHRHIERLPTVDVRRIKGRLKHGTAKYTAAFPSVVANLSSPISAFHLTYPVITGYTHAHDDAMYPVVIGYLPSPTERTRPWQPRKFSRRCSPKSSRCLRQRPTSSAISRNSASSMTISPSPPPISRSLCGTSCTAPCGKWARCCAGLIRHHANAPR